MIPKSRHSIVRRPRLGQTSAEREQLALHLLRALPEEQSARIVERLFNDEPFAAEMEEVERDLLDAYVRDCLSGQEKAGVENFLLTSDAQLSKVRFARAMARQESQTLKGSAGKWYAIAAIVLGVMGFAGLAGKLLLENRRLKSEMAALRAAEARPVGAAAVSFLLSPVSRSAGAEVLRIVPSANLVRLDLALGNAAPDQVDVRVTAENGAALIERRQAKTRKVAGTFYVSVWLSAADLPPGAYSIAVQTNGGQNTDYSFRVN